MLNLKRYVKRVVTYIEVLSWHLARVTVKNHANGFRVKIEPGNSNTKRHANHSADHFGLRRNRKAANSEPRCGWYCFGACCNR
jgi:hypothetical protein